MEQQAGTGRSVAVCGVRLPCAGCGEAMTPHGEYCALCVRLMGEYVALDFAAEQAERARTAYEANARLGDSAACAPAWGELRREQRGIVAYTPTEPSVTMGCVMDEAEAYLATDGRVMPVVAGLLVLGAACVAVAAVGVAGGAVWLLLRLAVRAGLAVSA